MGWDVLHRRLWHEGRLDFGADGPVRWRTSSSSCLRKSVTSAARRSCPAVSLSQPVSYHVHGIVKIIHYYSLRTSEYLTYFGSLFEDSMWDPSVLQFENISDAFQGVTLKTLCG